jgi:DNA-directed RNA polymerase subunit N (RpoN/RPB10)
MIIPIRCFTCGKVVANKWETYKKRVLAGETECNVLNDLGMKRYCCRRMFLGQVDNIDKVLLYSETETKH